MKTKQYFYCVVLSALLISSTAHADDEIMADKSTYQPTAEAMILDGLVYRPLSLAGTLVGTGIFIVTLPFSLIGGNPDQAGHVLVVEPAEMTFKRCLGCLPDYDNGLYQY